MCLMIHCLALVVQYQFGKVPMNRTAMQIKQHKVNVMAKIQSHHSYYYRTFKDINIVTSI